MNLHELQSQINSGVLIGKPTRDALLDYAFDLQEALWVICNFVSCVNDAQLQAKVTEARELLKKGGKS